MNRRKNEELQALLKIRTEELRQAELMFSTVFENSPSGLWISTPQGKLEHLNRAYMAFSNLTVDDDPHDWVKHVHPDDRGPIEDEFRKCMETHIKAEFRFMTGNLDANGDQEVRWVEGTGGPVYQADGNIAFCTGALMDVTVRKQNELYQQRRAEDALAMRKQLEHFIDFVSFSIHFSQKIIFTDG